MLMLDITYVANNVISQVMSQPLPLLPGVQDGQTSTGHLTTFEIEIEIFISTALTWQNSAASWYVMDR